LTLKSGLPPIARRDARVLILGSLPGDASLAAQEYYAHPRNQFWPLVGVVIGRDIAAMDYSARVDALSIAGIALWDVVAEAHRYGSLDEKIRNAQANDLRSFASQLGQLRAVAFNGKKAAVLAAGAFDGLPVNIGNLPSSSPAYSLSWATKVATWGELS